jgi:hypothetical protein
MIHLPGVFCCGKCRYIPIYVLGIGEGASFFVVNGKNDHSSFKNCKKLFCNRAQSSVDGSA